MPDGFSRVTTTKGQRLLGYDPQRAGNTLSYNTPQSHKQYFQQVPISQTKYISYNPKANIQQPINGVNYSISSPNYPRNYNNLPTTFNENAVITNNIGYSPQGYPQNQMIPVANQPYQLSPPQFAPVYMPNGPQPFPPNSRLRQQNSVVSPYQLGPGKQDRKISVYSASKTKAKHQIDEDIQDQTAFAQKLFLGFWAILLILLFVVAMFFLIQHRQLIGKDVSGASVEDQGMDADSLIQIIIDSNSNSSNTNNQGSLNTNNPTAFMFPPNYATSGGQTGYMLPPTAHHKVRQFSHD